MSRHYVSSEAVCPFYKGEDDVRIVCEGSAGATWHMVFPTQSQKGKYTKDRCRSFGYEVCPFSYLHEAMMSE